MTTQAENTAQDARVPRWAMPATVRRVSWAVVALAALLIVLAPAFGSRSLQTTVILSLVVAIGASGLNIITGYTGYLSIGHFAFIGMGAYTCAVMAQRNPDSEPLVWVPLAGVITGVVATLLGLVTYRSRGPSFVIISIAFLFLVRFIGIEWRDVTGGTSGLTMPMYTWPRDWGEWPIHVVLVVLLVASLALSWWIRRTKFGLGLIAIREDEGKAGTVGVNAPVYKLLAFAASAVLVGMAGAVYGYYLGFVDPINMFSILLSLQLVLALILGGRGTLFGPVLGAFIVVPLDTFANNVAGGGNARLVFFGLLLILLVTLLPQGILNTVQAKLEHLRTRHTVGLSGQRLDPLVAADDEAATHERPAHADHTDAPVLLEVSGLAKAFGANKAVNDCSFDVRTGTITSLIGPNGSGKTTVFNLISGTLRADAGAITMDGKRIEGLEPWARAHLGIGRTFQTTRLFKEMTVVENVVAPLRKFRVTQLGADAVAGHEADHAMDLLSFVGLQRYRDARAGSLSYGQQKLVELAQILVLDPKLIMLDEPAGGINPTLIERMGDLISDLNARGTSFLLVEHNMPFVLGISDRIHVLAQGGVIASGTPDEIQEDPAVIDAYLGDDYLLDSASAATRSASASEGK